jgi:hypothetical protein
MPELTRDILAFLGAVGNVETVELLRSYADDPDLGGIAISSIRQLINKQAP